MDTFAAEITFMIIFFMVLAFVIWLIEIAGAAWLAKEKGRSSFNWGILAALFGIFAIIFLALAPSKK